MADENFDEVHGDVVEEHQGHEELDVEDGSREGCEKMGGDEEEGAFD